ncbi:MAG TPA: hypothetical protein VMQ48_00400, partial [Candidatus Saccharimonadales bacterium]|nr:hypothetical protein [Candidatus Saccharimonadales bacterium]
MPRKTKSKSARVAGGKAIIKKTKTSTVSMNHHRKDMRFKVSLVILIGMLTFSAMLLLLSLNKSSAVNAETGTITAIPASHNFGVKKSSSQTLNDSALDFTVTVPVELGAWFYKIGEVKSLTDKSLSDQYFRVYVANPGVKSNNFDEQNKDILTIRKFSADEWSAVEKSCQKNKSDICDAAGTLIVKSDKEAYAYTKPVDCPKSIVAKCNLTDKIIESFNLK